MDIIIPDVVLLLLMMIIMCLAAYFFVWCHTRKICVCQRPVQTENITPEHQTQTQIIEIDMPE